MIFVRVKSVVLVFGITAFLLIGCAGEPSPVLETSSPVPIATETPPPTVTKTEHPTGTPTPTQTPAPTLTSTPELLLEGPLLALVSLTDHKMYLIDIYQERARELYIEDGHPTDVQWIGNGCGLYITLTDWDSYGQKVIRTDLVGNVLEDNLDLAVRGLSPSGEWMASLNDSGELWGMDGIPEFQDLVIIPVKSDGDEFILSENRGVDRFAWSPDGQLIAYSDYDEHNALQMYVSDIEERSRLPISQFTEGMRLPQWFTGDNIVSSNVSEPVWSPDSDLLAYVHFGFYRLNELDRVGSVWIASPEGGWQYKISHATIPTEPGDTWTASILGWNDDGSLMAFTQKVRYESEEAEIYVYWVNPYTGAVVRYFALSSLIDRPTYSPIAIAGIDTLLIRGQVAGEDYVYDYASETVTPVHVPILGEPDIIHFRLEASPSDFPGETACKEQNGMASP